MFDLKNMKSSENKEACACTSTQGLFMHNKQVSLMVASLLMLSFFLFMGGYFLGQKNAIATFSNKIDQESFSDQIYSSMCSLSDNGTIEEDSQENEENGDSDNRPTVAAVEQELISPSTASAQIGIAKIDTPSDTVINVEPALTDDRESDEATALKVREDDTQLSSILPSLPVLAPCERLNNLPKS